MGHVLNDIDFTVLSISGAHKKAITTPWEFKHNVRPNSGILCVLSGSQTANIAGHSITISKGDTLFFQKGSAYKVSSSCTEFIIINFEAEEDGIFSQLGHVLPTSPISLQLFKQIDEYWHKKKFGYLIITKALLSQLIYNYIYENLHIRRMTRLDPAIEYIHEFFDTEITIKTLADLCGFSEPHFRRLFKELSGTSPTQYINNVRILKAKDLITTSLYSMSEIAVLCGFKSIYYFSRKFKELTGITPKNYE